MSLAALGPRRGAEGGEEEVEEEEVEEAEEALTPIAAPLSLRSRRLLTIPSSRAKLAWRAAVGTEQRCVLRDCAEAAQQRGARDIIFELIEEGWF